MAEPFMSDHHFKRAVILLCDHEKEGSVGFVLNKPMGLDIKDLVNDFPDFSAEVHFGGPVQTDSIHYVHTKGELLEGAMKIEEGLYWGGNYEQLKVLIRQGLLQQNDITFFVGYSGWGEGQLQEEIDLQTWILAENDRNFIFQAQDELLWKKILENLGDRYSVMAQMPIPIWN